MPQAFFDQGHFRYWFFKSAFPKYAPKIWRIRRSRVSQDRGWESVSLDEMPEKARAEFLLWFMRQEN